MEICILLNVNGDNPTHNPDTVTNDDRQLQNRTVLDENRHLPDSASSDVSRISFRGGGFKIFLKKWEYFNLHGAKLGGFGGMLPRENF